MTDCYRTCCLLTTRPAPLTHQLATAGHNFGTRLRRLLVTSPRRRCRSQSQCSIQLLVTVRLGRPSSCPRGQPLEFSPHWSSLRRGKSSPLTAGGNSPSVLSRRPVPEFGSAHKCREQGRQTDPDDPGLEGYRGVTG